MIAVVADSACDLPPETADRAGIRVVPLTVTIGGETFRDREEMSPDAFWDRMRGETGFPTTASPSPQALVDAYDAAGEDGAEGVVSIHVSLGLSRTADTARMAATMAGVPVIVLDSGSVSLGEGLVAIAAARATALGEGLEAVAEAARSAAARVRCFVFLETVEFLKRGGRVGRARAALSDLLRVRPVLALEDGEPVLVARCRTRARAVEDLRTRLAPADHAAVMHSGAAEAGSFAVDVERECGSAPLVAPIGPVTGAHLGPGALGVAFIARR